MEASEDLPDEEMAKIIEEMLGADSSVTWPARDQEESIFTSVQGPY